MGKQPKSKFTNDDLKVMQSWNLNRKIATSLTRIAEFYAKYPHKIYVSSVVRYNILYYLFFAAMFTITLTTFSTTFFRTTLVRIDHNRIC